MSSSTAVGLRWIDEGGFLWEVDEDCKDANRARASRLGLPACEHCGNPVKAGQGWVAVVAGGGSAIIHTDDAERADALNRGPVDGVDEEARRQFVAGYMGTYLLGPRCGTRIPREYRSSDTSYWYNTEGKAAF